MNITGSIIGYIILYMIPVGLFFGGIIKQIRINKKNKNEDYIETKGKIIDMISRHKLNKDHTYFGDSDAYMAIIEYCVGNNKYVNKSYGVQSIPRKTGNQKVFI